MGASVLAAGDELSRFPLGEQAVVGAMEPDLVASRTDPSHEVRTLPGEVADHERREPDAAVGESTQQCVHRGVQAALGPAVLLDIDGAGDGHDAPNVAPGRRCEAPEARQRPMVRFFVPDPADPDPVDEDEATKLGDIAAGAGLARVHFLAWRDLDDPEAGGSEVHAHEIARRWARAGIDITFRTSYAPGQAQVEWRDGYRVIRRAGRYGVFPRAAFSEATGRHGGRDALVEIWNGMPFFSPLWAKGPSITFLHHVHAEMWDMTLPPNLARVGRGIESTLAPPLYRRKRIVTLSESSREELIHDLHFHSSRVSVVEPGIDTRFTPGPEPHVRDPDPLVVAVGRLVPVKRFDRLVDVLATVKARQPRLRAVIVGEGYERNALESLIAAHGAEEWIELPGRIDDAALVALYRRAWIVASASAREGWGMTLTEAAACGTPAVVTDIAGHRDAIDDGVTGILARDPNGLVEGLDRLAGDEVLRRTMGLAAAERATRFTWDTTARRVLEVLADEAGRAHSR